MGKTDEEQEDDEKPHPRMSISLSVSVVETEVLEGPQLGEMIAKASSGETGAMPATTAGKAKGCRSRYASSERGREWRKPPIPVPDTHRRGWGK